MIILTLLLLLLSNSITLRRDKSILYSRVTITILVISSLITYDNLNFLFLNKGIGIFGGLFHITSATSVFHIFFFSVSSIILLLTSFYPRKVWLKDYNSLDKILFGKLIYYQTIIINKMGEQYKIIEYSILSNKNKYNLNIIVSSISMWFERWFLSSNAKDIGVLYLIYALFAGLVGTAFSVLIRLELSGPGVQFIPDNQLHNSIITAHAIIMIFFMVIPILAIGLLLITLALASKSKDNRATLGIKILATFLLTTIVIVYIVPAISKDIASFYHILYIQIAVLILYYFPSIINEIRSNYNTNYSLSLIIINDSISNLYVVLLYIGMAMIILDIFKTTKESLSILDKARKIYVRFKLNPLLLIIGIIIFIFLVNIICSISGVTLIQDNPFLFFISLMCRIIYIKVIISFIVFLVTKDTDIWHSTISMSVWTPLHILPMSYFYFFYLIPVRCYLFNVIYNNTHYVGYSFIKLVGIVVNFLESIVNLKYKPGKSLIILADMLLADLHEQELQFYNRKRLLSVYGINLGFRNTYLNFMLQNNRGSVQFTSTSNTAKPNTWFGGYEKLRYVPNLKVQDSWRIIANPHLEGLDKFIRPSSLKPLYCNGKFILKLHDYIVELNISANNPNPIAIKVNDAMGKDIIPKDISSINKYLDKLSKDLYLDKLNKLVNNSIKDMKKINVFSSHGNQPDYPFFNNTGIITQGSPSSHLVTGNYQQVEYLPESNPNMDYEETSLDFGMNYDTIFDPIPEDSSMLALHWNMNNQSTDTDLGMEMDLEIMNEDTEDCEENDVEMQLDDNIFDIYPCITVSTAKIDPNFLIVSFDLTNLKGDNKWNYFLALCIKVRDSVGKEYVEKFSAGFLYIEDEDNRELLFKVIYDAYVKIHPSICPSTFDIKDMYICSESFIDSLEKLCYENNQITGTGVEIEINQEIKGDVVMGNDVEMENNIKKYHTKVVTLIDLDKKTVERFRSWNQLTYLKPITRSLIKANCDKESIFGDNWILKSTVINDLTAFNTPKDLKQEDIEMYSSYTKSDKKSSYETLDKAYSLIDIEQRTVERFKNQKELIELKSISNYFMRYCDEKRIILKKYIIKSGVIDGLTAFNTPKDLKQEDIEMYSSYTKSEKKSSFAYLIDIEQGTVEKFIHKSHLIASKLLDRCDVNFNLDKKNILNDRYVIMSEYVDGLTKAKDGLPKLNEPQELSNEFKLKFSKYNR